MGKVENIVGKVEMSWASLKISWARLKIWWARSVGKKLEYRVQGLEFRGQVSGLAI